MRVAWFDFNVMRSIEETTIACSSIRPKTVPHLRRRRKASCYPSTTLEKPRLSRMPICQAAKSLSPISR
jgi:hypothetical protein